MTSKDQILKIIGKLLDDGKGFCLNSHGTKNDSNYFNFALYKNTGGSVCKHGNSIDEMLLAINQCLEMNGDTLVLNSKVLQKAKKSIPNIAPIPMMPMPTPRG